MILHDGEHIRHSGVTEQNRRRAHHNRHAPHNVTHATIFLNNKVEKGLSDERGKETNDSKGNGVVDYNLT